MTPDDYTNQELMLDVGDGHSLYVQDWGNKHAKTPVIFLHGGPGDHCSDRHKQNFDPATQRVIFHDQRGCGRSLPFGSLAANTTDHLVADIARIMKELGVTKAVVFGASWGSCLALAFALKHPRSVAALVIGGVFTGSQREIDWLDTGKFRDFFPDVWDEYLAKTPKKYHAQPLSYHLPRIFGKHEQEALDSAHAYNTVAGKIYSLDDRYSPDDPLGVDLQGKRTELHYMSNRCFMPDEYILKNASKLHMPVRIVQGRYDMMCPPVTGYRLHQALPDSELYWTLSNHRNEHEDSNMVRTLIGSFTN